MEYKLHKIQNLHNIQEKFIGKEINGNIITSIDYDNAYHVIKIFFNNLNSKNVYYRNIYYNLDWNSYYIIIFTYLFNDNEFAIATIEDENYIKAIDDETIKRRNILCIYDIDNGEMIYDYRTTAKFSW